MRQRCPNQQHDADAPGSNHPAPRMPVHGNGRRRRQDHKVDVLHVQGSAICITVSGEHTPCHASHIPWRLSTCHPAGGRRQSLAPLEPEDGVPLHIHRHPVRYEHRSSPPMVAEPSRHGARGPSTAATANQRRWSSARMTTPLCVAGRRWSELATPTHLEHPNGGWTEGIQPAAASPSADTATMPSSRHHPAPPRACLPPEPAPQPAEAHLGPNRPAAHSPDCRVASVTRRSSYLRRRRLALVAGIPRLLAAASPPSHAPPPPEPHSTATRTEKAPPPPSRRHRPGLLPGVTSGGGEEEGTSEGGLGPAARGRPRVA